MLKGCFPRKQRRKEWKGEYFYAEHRKEEDYADRRPYRLLGAGGGCGRLCVVQRSGQQDEHLRPGQWRDGAREEARSD